MRTQRIIEYICTLARTHRHMFVRVPIPVSAVRVYVYVRACACNTPSTWQLEQVVRELEGVSEGNDREGWVGEIGLGRAVGVGV